MRIKIIVRYFTLLNLQIEQGEVPDNNLDPHLLSPFEQRHLKDAFAILDKAQNYLKFCYTAHSSVK